MVVAVLAELITLSLAIPGAAGPQVCGKQVVGELTYDIAELQAILEQGDQHNIDRTRLVACQARQ